MNRKYLLGIDAGTSLIKATIYDLDYKECGAGSRTVAVESPRPSWAQQDPNAVWDATVASIREAIKTAGIDAREIAIVGPSGQGDGAWMLDEEGNPISPAPLWNDGRAAEIIAQWEREGILTQAFKTGGTLLWPGSLAPILAWLRENEPETFDRIETVFCCKDWIKYKLTGAVSTDETDGSIPFMAMATRQYGDRQINLLGFPGFKNKLPPVKQSHEIIGEVTAGAAAETGLITGTPVVSGMIDVAANAIGAGVIHAGQAFSIIGTTALNALVLDQAVFEPQNVLRVLGAISGTFNLDWYLATMGQIFNIEAERQGTEVFALLEQVVAETPVGSGGVIYHPYLKGERAPFLNPLARAGFFGMSDNTTHNHLARAVYEGVALSVRDCYENIGANVTQVTLTGGGSHSPVWCQILADVVGCPMVVPAGTQFGTLGAAIAGAVGVGLFESYEYAAERCMKEKRIYEPCLNNVNKYDALYALYADLIEKSEPFWNNCKMMLDEWEE
jgi:sugar (pentulose or hexulose) kinase